ncbi:hypothetical protein ccbrp13_46960 [Ktedonobacteria bacterium brp13]|nr:hypothetical protein ccbrp13_46960 [Ktedonobacteria bacterium brp13]
MRKERAKEFYSLAWLGKALDMTMAMIIEGLAPTRILLSCYNIEITIRDRVIAPIRRKGSKTP